MSIRMQRISEQVKGEIARVLREDSHDPRIGMVSITRVKVSSDLSTALIFWSPLDIDGKSDVDEVQSGLESAAGFVRRQLAQNLELRRTPSVQFKYDPSIEEGSETLALIRSLEIQPEPPDESIEEIGADVAESSDPTPDLIKEPGMS